jgi:hexosaminidase
MKKITKILRITGYSLIVFVVLIVLSLLIIYSILDSRKDKEIKELSSRTSSELVPAETKTLTSSDSCLNLIPVPRNVRLEMGTYSLPSRIVYSIADSLRSFVSGYFSDISGVNASFSKYGGNIVFMHKADLPVQGYRLSVNPDNIIIEYSSRQGLYYSLVTLKVLRENYSGILPCCSIEDYPDIEVRGVMLDISRDKVPAIETLKSIVQLLADLKYNHLQLYIEGFSYAYPSFRDLWQNMETPITGDEIRELDAFCKSRYIDLVPNQNTLGHMMAWLATDEFKDLAECPNGYKALGLMSMKGTLDPSDPRSIELVTRMSDDLLPNFTSPHYNVNLDEPLELGLGKSRELVKKKGEGQVYLDYMLKVHKMVTERNKKMMVWGDIVMKHPELLPVIPKDIIILDWGYESSYPFERHCKSLREAGISYMVCPGTNSWTSIAGRTDNMLRTIESAAVNGTKYGAKGILVTDWGDLGHWQYLPVSYAGFAAGASMGWNSNKTNDIPLGSFLSSYVFRDKNSIMGNLVLELGRYCSFEEKPVVNMTTTFMSFQLGLRDRLVIDAIYSMINKSVFEVMNDHAPEMTDFYKNKMNNRHLFDYEGLNRFLNVKEATLLKCQLNTVDGQIVKDEYINTIHLIRTGAMLQYYIEKRAEMDTGTEKSTLLSIKESCIKYLNENQRLWLLRNKQGGYERSIQPLGNLITQIDNRLSVLEKPWSVWLNDEFFNKLKTAGIIMLLKAM